jgi:inner membrane protein involved in colicin E2 resistance
LIGSLGLFAALATVMYLSRQIDWYNLKNEESIDNLKK